MHALCALWYPNLPSTPTMTLVLHLHELHVCFLLISSTFVYVVVHVKCAINVGITHAGGGGGGHCGLSSSTGLSSPRASHSSSTR